MLRDITLGQYFPGKTVIHLLDPRTKIIFTLVYIVALFLCVNFVSYFVMFAVLLSCILISGINLKTILRSMRSIVIIVAATAFLNLFYTQGDAIAKFWIFTITKQGILNSVFMLFRFIFLITGTFLLTYTTSPIQLTDGVESLLNPLKKIRVPVHELAMMMSIALRFIPTLIEETDKIMNAQKARGASFDTGGLIQKAKAMLPLLIPLFISAFRRADELAVAMESRCYNGGVGKTKLKQLVYLGRDYAAMLICAVMLGAIIVLRVFGL